MCMWQGAVLFVALLILLWVPLLIFSSSKLPFNLFAHACLHSRHRTKSSALHARLLFSGVMKICHGDLHP